MKKESEYGLFIYTTIIAILMIIISIGALKKINKTDARIYQLESQLIVPKERVLIDTTQLVQYTDRSGSYAFDVKRVRIIHIGIE